MKKTIIAAAIAAVVAAPAAMAEVSISGQINQEFTNDSDDGMNANGTFAGGAVFGATDSNAGDDGLEQDTNVDVVLKSSEDLGNGMKVSAVIHLLKDHGSDANVTANETIAVSGDFGTVQVGRFEDFTESQISGVADTWDPMDGFSLEMQNTASARTNGGMAYVSPNFNGFQFGVGGFAVESGSTTLTAATAAAANRIQVNSAAGASALLANTDVVYQENDNNLDATDIMLAYSNGPLGLKYTRESFKEPNFTVRAAGAGNNIAASAAILNRATAGEESDNFAVSYAMGDLKVTATYQDRENMGNVAGADVDGYFVGAKYTMGANELSVGFAQHDYNQTATAVTLGANGAGVTGNAAETMEHEGYILGFKHNMSKNTGIYAAYQSQEVNYSGTTADRDDDRFGVGIQHKF
jgi:hypothetical protein